jgi:hypothetical protein
MLFVTNGETISLKFRRFILHVLTNGGWLDGYRTLGVGIGA